MPDKNKLTQELKDQFLKDKSEYEEAEIRAFSAYAGKQPDSVCTKFNGLCAKAYDKMSLSRLAYYKSLR